MTHSTQSPIARLATNLLIALTALMVTVVTIEIVLRQFYYPTDSPFNHRIPDPVLGWRLEPNTRFTNQNTEFSVGVVYNSKGWRDVEHDYEKPPGVFRIIVLGDSFMEAYSVELKDSFARQLERMITASGHSKVEVINLGVGGYSTMQEYLAFAEEGIRYEPDLVLLGFYVANDARNNSYEMESQAAGGLKVQSRPFLEPGTFDEWEITVIDYEGALATFEELRAEQESPAWWEQTGFYLLYKEGQERRGQIISRGRSVKWSIPGQDLGVHLCRESSGYTAAWTLTERILARLRDDVQEAGAELVVFTVPAYHEVDSEYIQAVLSAVDDPSAYCLEEAVGYDRLKSVLNQYGILYADLLPAFRQSNRLGQRPLFRSSDRHWDEQGHALAVWEVYSVLEGNGLLPPR